MSQPETFIETWRSSLEHFTTLTGMTVAVTTAEATPLVTFGPEAHDLCSLFRACPGGAESCQKAWLRWGRLAARQGEAVLFTGPCGLAEFAWPLGGEAATGFLVGGRVLLVADPASDGAEATDDQIASGEVRPVPLRWFDRRASASGVSRKDVRAAVSQTPKYSRAQLQAAAQMLHDVGRTVSGIAVSITRMGQDAKADRRRSDAPSVAIKLLDFLRTEVAEYRTASLQLLSRDGSRIQLAVRGKGEEASPNPFLLRPVPYDPLVKRVVAGRKALIIPDVEAESLWSRAPDTADVGSWMGLPFFYEEEAFALITVDHTTRGAFTEQLRPRLEEFVARTTNAVLQASKLLEAAKALSDLRFINEVIEATAAVAESDALLEILTRRVAEKLSSSRCAIFLPTLEGNRRVLRARCAHGGPRPERLFDLDPTLGNLGVAGSVFLEKRAKRVFDTRDRIAQPHFVPGNDQGDRSMLVVPIRSGDQCVGVISADHDTIGWFTENDQQVVEALGTQLGACIQRAEGFTLIGRVGQEILALRDVRRILEAVVAGAIRLLNASTGVIYLLSPDGMSLVEGDGGLYTPPGHQHPKSRLEMEDGVTRTVWRTGKPVYCPDFSQGTLNINPELIGMRLVSMAAVPIHIGGRPIGVFFVDDTDVHHFTATERLLLETLAYQAAIAIQNTTLLDERDRSLSRHEALENVLTELVGQDRDLSATLDAICRGICRVLAPAKVTATINLFDSAADAFTRSCAEGPLSKALLARPRKDGISRYAVSVGHAVYVPHATSPPKGCPQVRDEALHNGIVSLAALPLIHQARTLGVIFVNSQSPLAFESTAQVQLEHFAHQAVVAIEIPRHEEASVRKRRLDAVTARRESALLSHFRRSAELDPQPGAITAEEPLVIVARRWNSWYPSYFAVDGGAYAVVMPAAGPEKRIRGALIDPGFRALAVLRGLGVPVSALDSCLITHNHPDHVGGVFEYLAARHVLNAPTDVFATQSALEIVNAFSRAEIRVSEFDRQNVGLIDNHVDAKGETWRVSAKPFETCHAGVGAQTGATRGVLLSLERWHTNEWVADSTAAIVGDTEYSALKGMPSSVVFDGIRQVLLGNDGLDGHLLRFVVLHIGSAQLKNRRGGHLYLDGLISLLKDIEYHRATHGRHSPKLPVLVSEWGLEHASVAQVRNALGVETASQEVEEAFSSGNLLEDTVDVVRSAVGATTLTILPADLGLRIGLRSGTVFTAVRKAVQAEDVRLSTTEAGVVYE